MYVIFVKSTIDNEQCQLAILANFNHSNASPVCVHGRPVCMGATNACWSLFPLCLPARNQ